MDKRNYLTSILSAIGFGILILDGKTAVHGVQEGLALCLQTLIPALFPFLFLSAALTASLSGYQFPFLRPLGRLCRIPQSCESILVIGWLGGYPVGARCASELCTSRTISVNDCTRLAIMCNLAGPAFIFGVIGSFFTDLTLTMMLWLTHILSSLCAGSLIPEDQSSSNVATSAAKLNFTTILSNTVKSMASVCGCVVLFRVMIEFLNRWFFWSLPQWLQILLTGAMELSNGCLLLSNISQEEIRFVLTSVLLSFGGLCVWMQTVSVFPNINLKLYIKGKLLHTMLSLIISVAMLGIMKKSPWMMICSILILSAIIATPRISKLEGRKKEVAF